MSTVRCSGTGPRATRAFMMAVIGHISRRGLATRRGARSAIPSGRPVITHAVVSTGSGQRSSGIVQTSRSPRGMVPLCRLPRQRLQRQHLQRQHRHLQYHRRHHRREAAACTMMTAAPTIGATMLPTSLGAHLMAWTTVRRLSVRLRAGLGQVPQPRPPQPRRGRGRSQSQNRPPERPLVEGLNVTTAPALARTSARMRAATTCKPTNVGASRVIYSACAAMAQRTPFRAAPARTRAAQVGAPRRRRRPHQSLLRRLQWHQ